MPDAAKTLADWLAGGTLEKERRPALWIYRQTFTDGGQTFVRDALVGLVRARPSTTPASIRPHERTLAKPKADRLALLAATKADLELVFLLTRAPALRRALDAARAAALRDRRRRRAARRLSHLRLRRARRAPGPRQERRGDHRRRPPPLRDGARVLEEPGRREAAGRALQALRDRRHGLAGRRSCGRSTACSRACRTGVPSSCSHAARDYFDVRSTRPRRTPSPRSQAHSRLPARVRALRAAGAARAADARGEARRLCRGRRDARRPGRRWTSPALEVALFEKLLGIGTDAIARGEHVSFTSDTEAAHRRRRRRSDAQAAILMRADDGLGRRGRRLGAATACRRSRRTSSRRCTPGIFGVSLEDAVY